MLVQFAPSNPQLRLLSPPSNKFNNNNNNSYFASSRPRLPPPGPLSRKLSPLSHDDQLLGVGLRTPPSDDMSTTYHQQAPPVYDNQTSSLCTSLAVHPHWSRFAVKKSAPLAKRTCDSRSNAQHHQCPSQQHQLSQQQGALPKSTTSSSSSASASSTSSSQVVYIAADSTTKPTTPGTDTSSNSSTTNRPADSLIFHSLRMPHCINPNGGHLADFAAQMTCLFWFESIDELKRAGSGEYALDNLSYPRLPPLAKPHDQFRKWVCNVLSTTQVTQNVILLALLFIYRLKMSTPQIKGRAGSEYRLLTVALMLGNKFLDDNTYTNKTWAEVSSFAVQEIHVMEVEFLNNMRYNLLASKDEWEEWLKKLACFHRYYERALKAPSSPIRLSSPSVQTFTSPLSSPIVPSSLPLSDLPPITPSSAICFSPSATRFRSWTAHNRPDSPPPLPKPNLGFPSSRKRSPETDLLEHPAKRQMPYKVGRDHPSVVGGPAKVADSTRLPVPHLTIVTNQESAHTTSYPTTSAYAPPTNAAPPTVFSLPPLQPSMRGAPVYQTSTTNPVVTQPAVTPTATMGVSANGYVSNGAGAASTSGTGTAFSNYAPLNYNTPSKHRSPGSLAAFASSPMVEPPLFAPSSGVHTPIAHTPISHSPSVYLQERPSPYKPIRHVNRLLYPPPSASLDQYHLAVPVQQAQMHYQPLGRRNDLRSGVVPEYVDYNRGQHHHVQMPGGPQGPFAP